MKHFGAQLAGLNNQVDGNEDSRLVVGANDTLVIMTPNQTGGQITDGSLDGFVINSPNGETHVLGADGREILISNIAAGGVGVAFNETVDFLPVLGHNTQGAFIWEDSLVSQAGGTARTVTVFQGVTIGVDPTSPPRSNQLAIEFTYTATVTRTAFEAAYPQNAHIDATITVGGIMYHGQLERYTANGATAGRATFYNGKQFTTSIPTGTTVDLNFTSTQTTGHSRVVIGDPGNSTNNGLHIGGTLTVGNVAYDTTTG